MSKKCFQDAYEPQYEKTSLIGFAALYAANIALYDELLFQNSEDNDLDEDLDSFTWDTSYLVSLVYSDSTEEGIRIEKQREYWSWYLAEVQKITGNN
ncbi:Imm5 family immunity protein [Anaerocolumna jejuensis]|uniref:Imm5 family immunity protein n=1 Tax=Anaerocolumna jejuensis TaxID=259063 RepID=UPI003F7C9CED